MGVSIICRRSHAAKSATTASSTGNPGSVTRRRPAAVVPILEMNVHVAVAIARRRRVDFVKIRRWSEAEGAREKYQEFRDAFRAARRK